jgi:hypothetical protein
MTAVPSPSTWALFMVHRSALEDDRDALTAWLAEFEDTYARTLRAAGVTARKVERFRVELILEYRRQRKELVPRLAPEAGHA